METLPSDRTNFGQSMMHVIKKNLGAGVLALPATFAKMGLVRAIIGIPILCLINTYCIHLLVKSSKELEKRMNWKILDYAELAKGSFAVGPKWMKSFSKYMSSIVDSFLAFSHVGVCCLYLVFVVDNIHHIIGTYGPSNVSKYYLFIAIFPVAASLSCIRTLRRLAIASTIANILHLSGIMIILAHLIQDIPSELPESRDRPLSDIAVGFCAAMFAFEGISVIMPVYVRMKRPETLDSCCGVINVSYEILLVLYFAIGLLGYLKYGEEAKGSITLNLPRKPLFDLVRAIFTISISLSYPLQLYIPAEIIWKMISVRLASDETTKTQRRSYEYLCRILLVVLTFALAMTVPKLGLLIDLVGSVSSTTVAITIPAIMHLATFWDECSGFSGTFKRVIDFLIIALGVVASSFGAYRSCLGIWETFGDPFKDQ